MNDNKYPPTLSKVNSFASLKIPAVGLPDAKTMITPFCANLISSCFVSSQMFLFLSVNVPSKSNAINLYIFIPTFCVYYNKDTKKTKLISKKEKEV